jgi:hypothetical protein
MQVLQPLTVGNVGASPRNVLDVLRVHKIDFQPANFQNLHQWNPVNPGGFHCDCANAALLQPIGKLVQILCEGGEHADRFRIPISGYRDINLRRADINSGGVRVQNRQSDLLVLVYSFAWHGLPDQCICRGPGPDREGKAFSQSGSLRAAFGALASPLF